MVSHKQIKEILKNWKLENEKLTYVSESVYYVGDNYIIKFSPNINDVENHISVSLAIESVGLSTATPIKTSTMNIEDYISKAALFGEIIGKLSVALSKIEVNRNQADIFTTVKEWAIPILLKKIDLPKEFIEKYEKKFGEIYESLPQQIIHRDLNPGNIILCGDNWGVLDFDLSERNIRIFDPCYATTAILSENFEEANTDKLNKWIEVYKRTLYGYDEVVKLSANEWKAIPYVVLSSQLISTAWFSEQEKYSELHEINKKMLDWMLLNLDNMLFE